MNDIITNMKNLAPGAYIDEDGKVVAPPLAKAEDLLEFMSECDEWQDHDNLKKFFVEHILYQNYLTFDILNFHFY